MTKWQLGSGFPHNYVLEGKGFYISYNRCPPLSDGPETALVILKPTKKFLILNGDFRKEYEKRIHSLEECIKFFRAHGKYKSPWSDDL